jgi:two-component system response regulator YesN
MYKVMLIDDQKRIIRGLKDIIDWEKMNCTIVGEAYNGEAGIDTVVETCPDIIITDIRMPKMDGLQMITELKKKGYEAEYIILSGYSEFEFAKKGMSLGVSFYILKPVEEKELEECVLKICNKLSEQQQRKNDISKFKIETNKKMEKFKDIVLKQIVNESSDSTEDILDLLYCGNINIFQNSMICAIIEMNNMSQTVVKNHMEAIQIIVTSFRNNRTKDL